MQRGSRAVLFPRVGGNGADRRPRWSLEAAFSRWPDPGGVRRGDRQWSRSKLVSCLASREGLRQMLLMSEQILAAAGSNLGAVARREDESSTAIAMTTFGSLCLKMMVGLAMVLVCIYQCSRVAVRAWRRGCIEVDVGVGSPTATEVVGVAVRRGVSDVTESRRRYSSTGWQGSSICEDGEGREVGWPSGMWASARGRWIGSVTLGPEDGEAAVGKSRCQWLVLFFVMLRPATELVEILEIAVMLLY